MTTVTEPAQQPEAPARAMTWRAIVLGTLLALLLAMLVPVNDWLVGNAPIFNNYMPPALSVVLLLCGLVVNPLLGRYRLRRGELAVITVMLLGLGGVVSSGLARYFAASSLAPGVLVSGTGGYETLQVPLTTEEAAAARAEAAAGATREFALFDRDANERLDAVELPEWSSIDGLDRDRDGGVSREEWIAQTQSIADWRWAFSRDLFIGFPASGPLRTGDGGLAQIQAGYWQGLPGRDPRQPATVIPGSRVTWRDGDGRIHQAQLAIAGRLLSGNTAPEGLLHLEAGPGRLLRGQRVGVLETAGMSTQQPGTTSLEILAIAPPGVPWQTWAKVLLAWSPLLVGGLLAMVALAGIVHRQWLHHERLPYPIAIVTGELMRDPERGRRWADLYHSRAFWTGFTVSALILTWHGLYTWGVVPIDITLESRSYENTFKGEPWDQAYQQRFLFGPRLYFSIIALTFLAAVDVGFSMWSCFVAVNLLFLWCASQNLPLDKKHVAQASLGGYAMLCLLILWMGRRWYGALLGAAFLRRGDAHARAAAIWVWALLVGVGIMLAFLCLQGAHLGPALVGVLLFLGMLLVLARMVAESGIPFLQTPSGMWINSVQWSVTGVAMPVTALLPLTLIGLSLLADSREAAMPYAVNAHVIAEPAGIGQRRTGALLLGVAVIGGLLAISTMIVGAYLGNGVKDGWAGLGQVKEAIDPLVSALMAVATGAGAEHYAGEQRETWLAYGIGFVLVAAFGVARMRWAWWPLHPIGILVCTSYPGWRVWFSIFLGWLAKSLVLRFGGSTTFQALKPVAIGLIAGEALVGLIFLMIRLLARMQGIELAGVSILPG